MYRRLFSKFARPSSFVASGLFGAGTACAGIAFCETQTQSAVAEIRHEKHSLSNDSSCVGKYSSKHQTADLTGRLLNVYDAEVEKAIFSHVSEEYNELGQVEVCEVDVTVKPHVFSQIGVIDRQGIRELSSVILRDDKFVDGTQPIVFCDIGSGVGNVLMQVLAEVPQCSRVVGVEIIPSRHRVAMQAFENAKRLFPQWFTSTWTDVTTTTTVSIQTAIRFASKVQSNVNDTATTTTSTSSTHSYLKEKGASFHMVDLVDASPLLRDDNVNVIFSHSWMFDDDLMKKFSDVVAASGSQMRMVVTSRPFTAPNGDSLLPADWSCSGTITLSADWNPKSPFFVYVRQ